MARANAKQVETVDLVSPDGEITRKGIGVGSKEEVSLRFDGYLPAEQQKLQAPEKPKGSDTNVPTTVGTGA